MSFKENTLLPNIKDYFTVTVGGMYLVDSSPFLEFGEYEATDSVNDITDNNLFDTYEEAQERINWLYKCHRLLMTTKNKANKLEIKIIRKIDYPRGVDRWKI